MRRGLTSGPEGLTPAGAKSARDGRQCDAAKGENRRNHDTVTWRVRKFPARPVLRPEAGQAAVGVAQDAEIVSRSSRTRIGHGAPHISADRAGVKPDGLRTPTHQGNTEKFRPGNVVCGSSARNAQGALESAGTTSGL